MFVRVGSWVCLFCVLVCCGCTGQQTRTVKRTERIFLWKANHPKTGHQFYLFGTIHVGRGKAFRLDRAVVKALSETDELVVEVDTSDQKSKKHRDRYAKKYGLLPPGTSLRSLLSKKANKLLTKTTQSMGLAPSLVLRMRPWMAALTLSAFQMGLDGFRSNEGKESQLFRLAQKYKKPIRSLETVESQLSIFSSLKRKLQIAFLVRSMLEITKARPGKSTLSELARAYLGGHLKDIERTTTADLSSYPEFRPLFEALLDTRNVRMIKSIKKLLTRQKRLFVAVGVGHFPGKKGLLALLKKEGYTLQRSKGLGPIDTPVERSKPGAQWVSLNDTSRGFSVRFPKTPNKVPRLVRSQAGQIAILTYESKDLVFHHYVTATQYPPQMEVAMMKPAIQERVLLGTIALWVRNARGKLLKREKVMLDGQPAYFVRVKNASTLFEGYVFFHKRRLFQFFVLYIGRIAKDDHRKRQAKMFFRSFRFAK
ncbi:MAG TPA: hypothetical protein DCE42_13400 [Myxococcales bacterium]|nr:hypothetical protein [Deltaproteobacteria bacterium]MBU52399.1 hypothetical protein [Deltaproteobacteria bacterium]HAA55753.1 hypothetical protein [Myxococcales bacterium]|tara:strand:+ start:16636 stop:18078 length:1443 start_codon:yes stop_codon:yes gene_type:complete